VNFKKMKVLTLAGVFVAGCSSSSSAPEWAQRNQRVIDEFKITGRARELPAVSVPLFLAPGQPVENAALPTATLAPGIVARLAWGRGALLEQIDMQANAVYPEQTLGEELIVIGRDGSATLEYDGKSAELLKDHVIYLQPGTKRSVKAGPNGWKTYEVYSPVRLDHIALTGQKIDGVNATFPDQGVTPSLQPGVVVNFNDNRRAARHNLSQLRQPRSRL
jgi:gluconolactonase